MSTAIQWTDITDNIIKAVIGGWWCRMISPGCVNCYAAKLNQVAFFGGNKLAYTGEPPELELRTDILESWARQRKPKRHFVASMTDIFGDWVPREWIFQYLDAMAAAPLQTFQLLTKRADIMQREVSAWCAAREFRRLPKNIWIGVSVEDRPRKERLEYLNVTPATVKFASFEPLLEDLDLSENDVRMLNWAIVGGESGPKARLCEVDWIQHIISRCRTHKVACFVKQLGQKSGEPVRDPTGEVACHVFRKYKHKKAGDMHEWAPHLRVREFPA